MSSRTPPERSPAVSSANQSLYEASERSCRARSRMADHAARAGGSGDSGAGRSASERVIYPQALSTVVEYKGPARGEGLGGRAGLQGSRIIAPAFVRSPRRDPLLG